MWKSRKKLESHARVDFTGGCKSIVFHKVLGAVSPPWGGILPNYPIFMEMGGISPHFMKMRWFYTIFSSVGWKWCPGGPGAETSTKPMLFLCLFRGSGHPKVGFGVDFHQKSSSVCFFSEITKMGGIPRNSTIFTHFPTFGRSPRPGVPERHGIYMYYQGSGKVRRGQEEMLILYVLPWFHIISLKIMILHEFLGFLVIFMILHENHENWDPPEPGRRNSMYYCTISHDMGSSFRWIPIISMFFMESTNLHEITMKS